MGEARRRRSARKTSTGSFDENIAGAVDYIRRGQDVSDHVLIGPLVRGDGSDARTPPNYFAVVSGEAGRARFDCFGAEDRELAEKMRGAVMLHLITRRPLVIQDLDDELRLARMANVLWPGEKVARIIADIERERAPSGHLAENHVSTQTSN